MAVRLGSRSQLRRAVARSLIQLCNDTETDLPADDGAVEEFVKAARHHRLAPLAFVRLRDTGENRGESLRVDREHAKSMFIGATMILDSLNDVLHDLPWVTFKGPVLSEHAHPVPGLRTFHDLDILVPPRTLRSTCTRLYEAGWQLTDREDMLRHSDIPGEIHWVSPLGIIADVHWSPINMGTTRRHFPDVTDRILDNREQVTVGPSKAWTLSPADTLVHVCLHAALSGANKLQMILDADQLARQVTDWGAVAERTRMWGASSAVALVMQRARVLLDTPLPPELPRLIRASAGLRAVGAVTDRLSPVPMLRDDASLARLVARAARPTGAGTVAEIARRTADGVSNRFTSATNRPSWEERAPAGPEALESYLSSVEAHASTG